MSYDIYIYNALAKTLADKDPLVEPVAYPPIGIEDIKIFMQRLEKYGYRLEGEYGDHKEYLKSSEQCPIQVSIYATEIAFSVPCWENSDVAIFEALQDASELSDLETLACYDPQTGEWLE